MFSCPAFYGLLKECQFTSNILAISSHVSLLATGTCKFFINCLQNFTGTWAGEAMRSVLTRGVSYSHNTVWPGFVSVSVWIVIYWSLNVAVQKFKAKK